VRFVDISHIRTRLVQPISTDDGEILSADVYLPPREGRYPVLVTRTPYDNNHGMRAVTSPAPADRFKLIAAHGFVVVAVDVRGQGDSSGTFVPFAHEIDDGATTLAWARALPECDGHVGVFGSGYAGTCAWAAATSGLADSVMATSPFGAPAEGMPWRQGTLRLDWLAWMHLVAGRTPPQPTDPVAWDWVLRQLPVRALDEAVGHERIWWRDWIDATDHDPFWEQLDTGLSGLDVAGLHVTGWWDQGSSATLHLWGVLQRSPGQTRQRLLVGPWSARATRSPERRVGGIDFGVPSVFDPIELLVEWFSDTLLGERTASSGADVFLPGRNDWVRTSSWPPASTPVTLWLDGEGDANTRAGMGVLARTPPTATTVDTFTYDPEAPVPWQPMTGAFAPTTAAHLTLDESHLTSRDDVLVFTSPPLDEALVLAGRPTAHLHVESSAPSTDWFVTVSDVFPFDAKAVHISHGAVHCSDGEVVVQLGPVGYELLPGHSIRVSITSSLFPLYARCLNGDEPTASATIPHVATQRLFRGGARPSRLVLPVAQELPLPQGRRVLPA
jgi:putative CocE/NonD family hydrolase